MEIVMNIPVPDDLITLTEAAGFIPGRRPSKRISVHTLHRWCRRGIRGIKLRSQLVGGHRMTTLTWLAEFLAAINNAMGISPPVSPEEFYESLRSGSIWGG